MASKTVKTREAFEAEIKSAEGRFVLFYSAWCPFCTSFMPSFEKLAKAEPGRCVRVCTDDLGELEDMFSVEVVPTVLFFEEGRLAARLDGLLGRGLSEENLCSFAATCRAGGKKK